MPICYRFVAKKNLGGSREVDDVAVFSQYHLYILFFFLKEIRKKRQQWQQPYVYSFSCVNIPSTKRQILGNGLVNHKYSQIDVWQF